jgi:hypothetical protein
MRLPRFRLRVLMIAVAVAGVAIAGVVGLRRRGESLRRMAQGHDLAARRAADALWAPPGWETNPGEGGQRSAIPDWERLAYHNRLKEKYERAARYPWLPVGPDPPEPE